jgi:hypothetical protein
MAAANASAMQAFAKQRERIARESKAVAELLRLLQSGFTNPPLAADLPQSGSLPPHLRNTFSYLHAKAFTTHVYQPHGLQSRNKLP